MRPPAVQDEGINRIIEGQKDVKVRHCSQHTPKKRRLARTKRFAQADSGNRGTKGELCQRIHPAVLFPWSGVRLCAEKHMVFGRKSIHPAPIMRDQPLLI